MSAIHRTKRRRELESQFPEAFTQPLAPKAFRPVSAPPPGFLVLKDRWPWMEMKKRAAAKRDWGILPPPEREGGEIKTGPESRA